MEKTAYVLLDDLSTPAKEAYKILRTNIRFCGVINELKTLTLTSCLSEEGKTLTAINLAISMSNSGMKTLLVNMDLRKPMAEKVLKVESNIGITDFITGEVELNEIIFPAYTENLFVIPCGPIPPNPAELINSEVCSDFIKNVSEMHFDIINGKFDMIIFDSPPLGVVIDAAILASQTDGTILVVKSKSTNYKLAQDVKEQLEKASANLIGVVLNNIKKRDLKFQYGYKYGYGGKYYHYYNQDEEKKNSIFRNLFKRSNAKR